MFRRFFTVGSKQLNMLVICAKNLIEIPSKQLIQVAKYLKQFFKKENSEPVNKNLWHSSSTCIVTCAIILSSCQYSSLDLTTAPDEMLVRSNKALETPKDFVLPQPQYDTKKQKEFDESNKESLSSLEKNIADKAKKSDETKKYKKNTKINRLF